MPLTRSTLDYSNFERLPLQSPVDRLVYITDACVGKFVIDVGCMDETAQIKRDGEHWLHGRICLVARQVLGVDNSPLVPPEGFPTGHTSRIVRGDATSLDLQSAGMNHVDVIVAGEFIEHIENPSSFLNGIKSKFPGRVLILSTPNGTSFSNTLMGLLRREVQHPDHLHNFTFKTLNTLCIRANFEEWEIIPYRFYATEMILRSTGMRRLTARVAEFGIRIVERAFPSLSFGYIIKATI